MSKGIKFPTSAELFRLVQQVLRAERPEESASDAAIGRLVGLESARTSRWKHGQINVDDAARLLSLANETGIDLFVLAHVAAGYLSADEAAALLSRERDFLRFVSEQLVLPRNEYAVTLTDSEGNEARVVRHAQTRHQRRFRRAGGHPISRNEQQRRVLLADDDPVTGDLFNNIIAKGQDVEGVRTTTLASAMIKCGVHRPHLVILDLFLSGGDGFDAVRAICANSALEGVRVVASSALVNPEIVRRAKGCGAMSVVERPIRARAMGKLLREVRLG